MTLQETNNSHINNILRLSVQISLNGLSFFITNEQGDVISFEEEDWPHTTTPEELLLELEKLFLKLPEQTNFSEVVVVYNTPVHSVIPSHLFDPAKGSEYLKFNSKILANDYVAHDMLQQWNLTIVHIPFMNINNAIFERFGSFHYYHNITILLKELLENTSGDTEIYVQVDKGFFNCVVLKNGKLQLSNSFPYTSPEDFLYYLLFVLEQLKMDPDSVPVNLCGTVVEGDALYTLAFQYIRNLRFLEKDIDSKLPFPLKAILS